jgi:hypothetical protein
MNARRMKKMNTTAFYVIAAVIIVVAFFLLGGESWIKGMTHMHGSRSAGMANLNWVQILVSLGMGFVVGLLVGRKKW